MKNLPLVLFLGVNVQLQHVEYQVETKQDVYVVNVRLIPNHMEDQLNPEIHQIHLMFLHPRPEYHHLNLTLTMHVTEIDNNRITIYSYSVS